MNLTLTTVSIIASFVAILFTLPALIIAILAYANVIGMKRSTHRILTNTSAWQGIPTAQTEDAEEDKIQAAPTTNSDRKPKTLQEQMAEFAYPDISREQV